MRICLFTPSFLPNVGGTERVVDALARGLTERGHFVGVLAEKAKGDTPKLPYPVRRYHRPPRQHRLAELIGLALVKAKTAWQFEIVIAFNAYPNAYVANCWRKLLGYKVIATPRGGDLYPEFHALKKPRVPKLIASGYQQADRIVSISRWLTQRIEQVTSGPLPPIDTAPNGLDLAEHDRWLNQATQHPPTMVEQHQLQARQFALYLATVSSIKDQLFLVHAIATIAEHWRQSGFRCVLAGRDGGAMTQVRQAIRQHQLNDLILTLGSRSGADKYWLLANARFMISTSRREGLPNSIIEAMASGLPVLASNIGPHEQLMEIAPWGRTVELDDIPAWSAALQQMTDNDLTEMRQQALTHRDQFSIRAMIDAYEQACQAAVS